MARRQQPPSVPWWADEDPWRLSPAEEEAAAERRRDWEAQREATPENPPF